MLVLDMIYVDWIVKKEKSTGTLRCLSHALDPFRVWGVTVVVGSLISPLSSSLLWRYGCGFVVIYELLLGWC